MARRPLPPPEAQRPTPPVGGVAADRALPFFTGLFGVLEAAAGASEWIARGSVFAGVAGGVLGAAFLVAALRMRGGGVGWRLVAMGLGIAAAAVAGVRLAAHAPWLPTVPVAGMALVLVRLLRVPPRPPPREEKRSPIR